MYEDGLSCMLEKLDNYEKINEDILNKIELINKSIKGDECVFVSPTFGANMDKTVYKHLCEEATQLQLSSLRFNEFLESYKSIISDTIEAHELSN